MQQADTIGLASQWNEDKQGKGYEGTTNVRREALRSMKTPGRLPYLGFPHNVRFLPIGVSSRLGLRFKTKTLVNVIPSNESNSGVAVRTAHTVDETVHSLYRFIK